MTLQQVLEQEVSETPRVIADPEAPRVRSLKNESSKKRSKGLLAQEPLEILSGISSEDEDNGDPSVLRMRTRTPVGRLSPDPIWSR